MSTYSSFVIQNKPDLCEWILRKLGSPLVTVELTSDQLDDAINEAVEEFTKYVNQERQWLALQLDTYDEVSGFILPENCIGVFALNGQGILGGSSGGINTLFSVGNQLANSGNFGGVGGNAAGFAESWITYEAALQHIELIKRMTASEFRFEFNVRSKSLTLIPNPVKQAAPQIPKGTVVVGCNTIREESQQYGESWVKRYALALSKITLGLIRAKFQGIQLLGGGVLDTSIKEEGIQERDALKEELKETEGSFMNFWVG